MASYGHTGKGPVWGTLLSAAHGVHRGFAGQLLLPRTFPTVALGSQVCQQARLPFCCAWQSLYLQQGLDPCSAVGMRPWQPGPCADLSVGMECPVRRRVSHRAGVTGEVTAETPSMTKETATGSHLWAAFPPHLSQMPAGVHPSFAGSGHSDSVAVRGQRKSVGTLWPQKANSRASA